MSTSALNIFPVAMKGDGTNGDILRGDILTDRICDSWLGWEVSYLMGELY